MRRLLLIHFIGVLNLLIVTAIRIDLPGDVILGGLFPIHEAARSGPSACGSLSESRGIQRLEAMLYAVDRINRNESLLPKLRLGVKILDTCTHDTYALEQSMDFIRTHLSTLDTSAQYECPTSTFSVSHPTNLSENHGKSQRKGAQPIVGVIGASDSSVSIMIANILRLFKIPQISYASTSAKLSDKTRYDYFARVVPHDNYQVQAMVEILLRLGWKYVATVFNEGTYGESGISEFTLKAFEKGICVSISQKIPRLHNNDTFRSIAKSLWETAEKQSQRTMVVVTFVQAESLGQLFKAIKAHQQSMLVTKQIQKSTNEKLMAPSLLETSSSNIQWLSDNAREVELSKFLWLGSDSWGRKSEHLTDVHLLAESAITLLPQQKAIADFDRYFKSLGLDHSRVNPWWPEYWQSHFQCRLPSTMLVSHLSHAPRNMEYKRVCTGTERIGSDEFKKYIQEGLVPMVMDAVYAMAHGLDRMHRLVCSNYPLPCPNITDPNGTVLMQNIKKSSFYGPSENLVMFNDAGDRESLYDIFQYQRRSESADNMSFDYSLVGAWDQRKKKLHLDVNSLRWSPNFLHKQSSVPRSVCSESCSFGHRMLISSEKPCCWDCIPCNKYQIVVNATSCVDCDQGEIPNHEQSFCTPLPVQHIEWLSAWALIPVTFSCVGLIWTGFISFVFMKFHTTPVIMASGRELCHVMLVGIALCYAMTFAMLARPSPLSCGLFRVFNGLSLSLIYSAIFTKTNRLSRIFNRGIKSLMKRPSYTSPRSQVILCACMVSVQVIGDLTWLGMDLPRTSFHYPNRNAKVLRCNVADVAIIVSLLYNMILIALCTVYALKTRKIPENFNEAKYIAFTMYSTCIVWLAFITIYFGSSSNFKIRITALCMGMSISASVTLCCMFMPKVYIVLFQPHKNVRHATASGGGSGPKRQLFGTSFASNDKVKKAMPVPTLEENCKCLKDDEEKLNFSNNTDNESNPFLTKNDRIDEKTPIRRKESLTQPESSSSQKVQIQTYCVKKVHYSEFFDSKCCSSEILPTKNEEIATTIENAAFNFLKIDDDNYYEDEIISKQLLPNYSSDGTFMSERETFI